MINIGKLLWNRAYISPDMEAFVGDGYRFSFRQANERSNQFASYLQRVKINAGDRIAVLCKNNEPSLAAVFGASKIGVVTLMLNWRLQPQEMIYILNDCGASLLFYDSEFSEVINELRGKIHAKMFLCVGISGPDGEFEEVLADQPSSEPIYAGFDDDTAVMMYTSGTTGKPKGVMLTHNNLFWTSVGPPYTYDVAPGYRYLLVAPLFHIGGLAGVYSTVHRGCPVVLMPNFDPFKVWDVISNEKINYMMSVPAMLQFMLMAPDLSKKDLSSLKFIACGGSNVPQHLIEAYGAMGIKVYKVYGITEYSGAVSLWTTDMGLGKVDSLGKTVFHGHLKILEPGSGQELPPGEVGEICCSGPQVFKGYWNNPAATAEVIKDGYFHSGDLGKIDEDGFVYVVDRLKDMIISGSENIYPAELEQVIMGHPAVAEVAVVGKQDKKWGEIPVAMIVPKPGAEVNADDIIAVCKKNLAGYKCVKEVHIVKLLPRNAVGKILKHELRAQLT